MERTRSNASPEEVRAYAIECARTCFDLKCTEVVVLDVKGQSQICDFIVVASGTSERQMRSVAQILEDLGKESGNPHYRSNRDSGSTWVVVDFVETIVHIFEPDQRLYYDIEALWNDGAQVDWARPDSKT